MWLGISVAAFVAAAVALYVDYTTTVDVQMGTYPVLSGLFAGGAVGWRIGAGERRLRIDLHVQVDILARRVEELAEQRPPMAPEAERALRRINLKLLNGGDSGLC